VLGTTDYVSPEQAMGYEVDERSDVYSLGVVLYEMLSGDVPYHAETQVGVAMRHVNDPMPDIQEVRPDVSAALAAVVDQATAKEVEARHGSVGELLEDLEATLDLEAARGGGASGQATAVLDTVPAKRRKFTRPGRASGAGIAMGVLGAALIVAALLVGGKELSGGGSGNAIELASDAATAFDPSSTGGDGSEHSEDAKLAIDANATGTSWPTETYDTDDFGGKPGVGLSVDAGKPVTVKSAEVRADGSGWDAEIRAAPGQSSAPADLSGWQLVGKGSDLGTKATIDVDSPVKSQYYLLWITKLPAGDGGFTIDISDLKLLD
jgi:serine/threonine-protein kinase